MPVLSGFENVGSIHEDDVLRRTLADETASLRTVQSILQPPFPEVLADAPVGEVLHRFKEEPTLLVRDPGTGAPLGVLTRHDLVAFLSEQGGSHAL